MKKILLSVITLCLVVGCTTSSQYHTSLSDTARLAELSDIQLEIMPLENGPFIVEMHPEPWRYRQVASAQYYSPPPSPNVSPGQAAAAGAIGGLVGTMITAKMAKSTAFNEAQKPAQPLMNDLLARAFTRDVREGVVDGVLSSEFAITRTVHYGPETDQYRPRLMLQPSVKLTNSMDVLKFNINAEVLAEAKEPLYRNSIEYWSAGTGFEDPYMNLAHWQEEELGAFYAELQQATMITTEFLGRSLSAGLEAELPAAATHKIAAEDGWVMLRGRLMESNKEYTVLEDLRGNIKIIRGTLVN